MRTEGLFMQQNSQAVVEPENVPLVMPEGVGDALPP
jgi:hypothetical protein